MLDLTPITPPRVPLIDPRTGLIERSWYMFFVSMFKVSQGSEDALLVSNTDSLIASYDAALLALENDVKTRPVSSQDIQQEPTLPPTASHLTQDNPLPVIEQYIVSDNQLPNVAHCVAPDDLTPAVIPYSTPTASENAAVLAATINAATSKTTPVDADELPLVDSAASNVLKKLTWLNLKTTLYAALGGLIVAGTGKTTPVDADAFAIGDSAASNATKTLTWANLKATMLSYLSNASFPIGTTTQAAGKFTSLTTTAASTFAGTLKVGPASYNPYGVAFTGGYNVGWTNGADSGVGTYFAHTTATNNVNLAIGSFSAPILKATNAGGYTTSDGSTGVGATVTTASLVGKTMTFKDGVLTGFA